MTGHIPDTGPWSRAPPQSYLSLTESQEAALRAYLDSASLGLERDERKHRLAPLSSLISRLLPLFQAILQLPAREPWASTRAAYLLALTANAPRYIQKLPLMTVSDGVDETDPDVCAVIAEKAGETMQGVLDLLGIIERGWIAVLRGEGWRAGEDSTGGEAVEVEGGQGIDQTSKVRLRSVINLAREKILLWARPYGSFGGESMGPDGVDGEVHTEEERSGWEQQIVDMWKGILEELDRQTPPEEEVI
ncbi:uncharacterized protein CcaverHIS019_0400380 [Cutaneotrichosporon cavernicola]|uniref:Uncharacterized protein n=1 Tax=Cutaneotrichosporon cavernicola TaxID=279322 RepID=A0AA48QVE1_9TREE|nr:uncharacterized protein CcaverHIS019_0400380 [Cutaneotrichosporon cavernicola]BEI91218.1 hypothetical protein CcaverHIS019_0400380 [Cutaneotrichosporon cavernicola]